MEGTTKHPFGNPNKRLTAEQARSRVDPISLEAILEQIEQSVKRNECFHVIPPMVKVTPDVVVELIQLGYKCYQGKDPIGVDIWIIDWR